MASTPPWFVSSLEIPRKSTIVVLDDDSSIHKVWDGRFHALLEADKDLELFHLSTPEDFKDWYYENSIRKNEINYLIDYELIGFQDNGLNLIETLNIGKKSFLVTSHFNEAKIQEGCERLLVRIIPKEMAGFVPIKLH